MKPFFLRTAAVALIGFSVAVMGVWFLWLLPNTLRHDPFWFERFTQKTYWKEVQKQIKRYGWVHDDFGPVGWYGDKSWGQWIIAKAEAGQELHGCKNGHKDSALEYITCNNPSRGTNVNIEALWISWWSTNKEKSQLQWIQAGLGSYGVTVHLPPSRDDFEPLLALLGNMNTNAAWQVPKHAKYNAFRWLRDSGFQTIPFALSNITAQAPMTIREGLVEYGKWNDKLAFRNNTPGILEFAASTPDPFLFRPFICEPKIQIAGYSLMTLPCLTGIVLLIISYRHRK